MVWPYYYYEVAGGELPGESCRGRIAGGELPGESCRGRDTG